MLLWLNSFFVRGSTVVQTESAHEKQSQAVFSRALLEMPNPIPDEGEGPKISSFV